MKGYPSDGGSKPAKGVGYYASAAIAIVFSLAVWVLMFAPVIGLWRYFVH